MAVLMNQVMPEGVNVDLLDEVTAEMGVDKDPPNGLVVHVHFEENGRTRIVDVWDSVDAYETFARDRLGPAMGRVAQRHGLSLDASMREPSVVEVASVVRGK
jgi:hypothetical protein